MLKFKEIRLILDPGAHLALKTICKERGISMRYKIAELVDEYVERELKGGEEEHGHE